MTTTTRKTARRRAPRRFEHQLNIRFSTEQWKKLMAAAKRENVTPQEVLRRKLEA